MIMYEKRFVLFMFMFCQRFLPANGFPLQEDSHTTKNRRNYHKAPRLLNKHSFFVELIGNSAQIDCSVTGAKPITVIWRKDNTVLESNVEGITYIKDGQILKIKRLRVEDHGRYQCILKNRYGSVNQTVQLHAQEVPKEPFLPIFDSKNLKIIEAAIGDNETVAEPVEVPFDSHYKLFFNQKEVNVPSTAPIIKEAKRTDVQYRNFTVKFYNISEKDYGNYTMVVENEKESDTKNFILRKPRETVSPSTTKQGHGKSTLALLISLVTAALVMLIITTFLLKRYLMKNKKIDKLKTSRLVKFSSAVCLPKETTNEYYKTLPLNVKWEIPRENITLKGFLGKGAFGQVMLASVQTNVAEPPSTVAVKMLKGTNEKNFREMLAEIQIMKTIGKHKNVVSLIGISIQKGEIWSILEYCCNGNLQKYLQQRRPTQYVNMSNNISTKQILTFEHLISYCLQVAEGMEYLASLKFVHRDLAARNILVAENHVVKIADFGLSRDVHVTDYYRKVTRSPVPYKWLAMESLFDSVYTSQSDVWSFGILMWEIFTFGETPYANIYPEQLLNMLENGYRLSKPSFCSEQIFQMMLNCWREKPTERPTFSFLVKNFQDTQIISESPIQTTVTFDTTRDAVAV